MSNAHKLRIESEKERERKRKLWESFEGIRRQETFLFLYLLHKPDYPYNIAMNTLLRLKNEKVLELKDFKTLLRPGEVASKISKMENRRLVFSKKAFRRGESKTYDVNLDIFLEFFFYKEDREESDNVTVLLNIFDLFRSLIFSAREETWLKEIDGYRKHDYFTVLCHLVDKIIEPIGGVYRNIEQKNDSWRDFYLEKITVIKDNPALRGQLIKGIDKIAFKRGDVPKLKENLTPVECIERIYDIQYRFLEIMESSIGTVRGFEPKFSFFE